MANKTQTAVGDKLAAYLSEHGMRQREFAGRVGVTEGCVANWIRGYRHVSVSQAVKFERVTGIPLQEWVTAIVADDA